jgi:hypothetical protein
MQEQKLVFGTVGSTNTIDFKIPTSDPGYNSTTGVWTIAVNEDLPEITKNAAIIDGYSQPGASKNTLAVGDNAKLAIALNGTSTFAYCGLTIDQPGSRVFGLDIENFSTDGVLVTAPGNTQVAGCFIGTGPTGETAAPNASGVELDNSFNLIGGPNVGDRNVISGNTAPGASEGVYVPDSKFNPLNLTPTGNVIQNNYIGLDASGTKSLANVVGVRDNGSDNTYGGTTAGLGNVISGNSFDGLRWAGSVTIEGNFVGTDAAGNVALGNGANGEGIFGDQINPGTNTVVISNNVISGNKSSGISVDQAPGSHATYTIANNLIGTNAVGTAALGNTGVGIELYAVENATVKNNVISGNDEGVRFEYSSIMTPPVQNDVLQGNLIGTDRSGLIALGNKSEGLRIDSGIGITIGGTGPGEANVIAHNGQGGIILAEGQQDEFTRNSIFGNGAPGIYLVSGANQFATPPVLKSMAGAGGSGMISGTVTGLPNTTYTVEIFSNPSAPALGQEQGKTFVQDVMVTTDGTGKGTFSVTEPDGFYTATDIDPSGNTSAFSNALALTSQPATVTTVSSSLNPSMPGQAVTFTAVVTASGFAGTPSGTVTFTIDGQAYTPVPLSVVGGHDEAQFATSTLAPGSHTVTAAYSGDASVASSTGSLQTQTVGAASLPASFTTLTSSLNPSALGKPVTFTADVTSPAFSGTPTGTVTFFIDGHAQASVPLSVQNGKDEARFVTSTLTAGAHTVTAIYSGDASVASSSGPLPTQTVTAPNLPPTTTTLSSSLSSSRVGQQVTFTAAVSANNSASKPKGTVTFSIDGTPQAPVALQLVKGNEVATFSISTLTVGHHTVSATYSGDATFAPSSLATPFVQTVNADPPPGLDRPTIKSVKRYGIHMQPSVVVVSFNDGLDPTSAQNMNNYKVVGPDGRAVAISSAVFDPAANTVTLRFKGRIDIHHNYELTVVGTGPTGVMNTSGQLLDGANTGQPGSDYNGILDWDSVVWTPAEAKKYNTPANAEKYDHPKLVKPARTVKPLKSVKPAGPLHHSFHKKFH